MALGVKRGHRQQVARAIAQGKVLGQPARGRAGGAAILQRREEGVAGKGVVIPRAGIPLVCRDFRNPAV